MTTKTKKWPLLLRIVSARPRLFLSILAGFAVATYWDFVYFAFAIGTATQVSDVEISSKRIRRTGIVSFFFNVMVIALTVGLVGDAIQN